MSVSLSRYFLREMEIYVGMCSRTKTTSEMLASNNRGIKNKKNSHSDHNLSCDARQKKQDHTSTHSRPGAIFPKRESPHVPDVQIHVAPPLLPNVTRIFFFFFFLPFLPAPSPLTAVSAPLFTALFTPPCTPQPPFELREHDSG